MRNSVLTSVTAAAVTVLTTAAVAVLSPSPEAGPAAPPPPAPPAAAPAIETFHPVVREPAAHNGHYATEYTLYRPADLDRIHGRLPVVVMGNGACRHRTNLELLSASTLLAAHGFLVVAVGGVDETVRDDGAAAPEVITDGITWAERENRRHGSDLRNRIDTKRVAVAGHSCGGIEAMVAGADRRVRSVISMNSGFFADGTLGYDRENLANLHSPVLFLDGGPDDVAYTNSTENFELVTVPAVHATNPGAGHVGFWYGTRDGNPDYELMTEAVTVLVNWLDFTLNDNRTARAYFLGPDCGLCAAPSWTVAARNFGA